MARKAAAGANKADPVTFFRPLSDQRIPATAATAARYRSGKAAPSGSRYPIPVARYTTTLPGPDTAAAAPTPKGARLPYTVAQGHDHAHDSPQRHKQHLPQQALFPGRMPGHHRRPAVVFLLQRPHHHILRNRRPAGRLCIRASRRFSCPSIIGLVPPSVCRKRREKAGGSARKMTGNEGGARNRAGGRESGGKRRSRGLVYCPTDGHILDHTTWSRRSVGHLLNQAYPDKQTAAGIRRSGTELALPAGTGERRMPPRPPLPCRV